LQHAHAVERAHVNRQGEGATLAELAGGFHIAAECLGQAPGYGQPEARAAVAAGSFTPRNAC
jgi:hypothetical protein